MSNRISPLFLILCYFLFPAYDPGESYHYPIEGNYALSGTFGELRPNHFHSGIDIKTYNKTGYRVFATEAGYLYRIKVSPYSYGKGLYLRHPDGRFSVYAHLLRFVPEIEDFVSERQQKDEQFEQEIYLEKDRFYFKKGQLIGYSGNSGNSFGPHLHFEIRDPSERIINALPYFDRVLKDNIQPTIQKVAFEPLAPASRINGKYEKLLLARLQAMQANINCLNPFYWKEKLGWNTPLLTNSTQPPITAASIMPGCFWTTSSFFRLTWKFLPLTKPITSICTLIMRTIKSGANACKKHTSMMAIISVLMGKFKTWESLIYRMIALIPCGWS